MAKEEQVDKQKDLVAKEDYATKSGSANKEIDKTYHDALRRLGELANTTDVLETFLGNGIAYEMPLGEIIGFLETQQEKAKSGGSLCSESDIAEAKDVLVALLDDSDFSERSYYIDVARRIEKETSKLEEVVEAGI